MKEYYIGTTSRSRIQAVSNIPYTITLTFENWTPESSYISLLNLHTKYTSCDENKEVVTFRDINKPENFKIEYALEYSAIANFCNYEFKALELNQSGSRISVVLEMVNNGFDEEFFVESYTNAYDDRGNLLKLKEYYIGTTSRSRIQAVSNIPYTITLTFENWTPESIYISLLNLHTKYTSCDENKEVVTLKDLKSENTIKAPTESNPRNEEQPEITTRSTTYTQSEKTTSIESFDFADNSKYFALLIGVEDYINDDDVIKDLDQPIDDMQLLKQSLVKGYSFEDNDVVVLNNPNREVIIDALEQLSIKLNETDNLLIFYAGHGVFDKNLQVGYWLPADAKSSSKANWLSNSVIRDYIAGIKTKHTLLITDACFSGSIFKSRSLSEELSTKAFANIYRLNSRKAITSGNLSEVPDRSKFIEYLTNRLNDNPAKYLTAKQLFVQVEIAVLNNTSNVPQYGTIQNAGDQGGDFIFIRR